MKPTSRYRDAAVRLILAAAAVTSTSPALFGQVADSVIALEGIRVEISRLRVGGVPLARAPLSAQGIGLVELRHSAHVSATEALGRLPGVTLADQFGSPHQMDVRLRGFSLSPVVGLPQSLSVFVDGVRVNEADASQVYFNLVPLDDIERIEVVRGPVGPFGKNSLAGALNIVTRRGDGPPTADVELSGGAYSELEGRARVRGRAESVDYYVSVGQHRSDGFRERNFAKQRQAFAKLGWANDRTDVYVSYTAASDSIEAPGSLPESWLRGSPLPADVLDPAGDRRRLRYTGGRGDYFRPDMHFVAANAEHRIDDRWTIQGNAFGRAVDFEQFNDNITECDALGLTGIRSGGGALQLSHRRGRRVTATVGAEFVRNDVDIEIRELPNALSDCADIPPAGNRTELVGTVEDNLGVYSEVWWSATPEVSLHASSRFDYVNIPFNDLLDPSQSGSNTFRQATGTLGLDYSRTDGVGAFASYGRGFRAPVILELSCADPEDPCPLPFELGADPPLDPVTTDTWQVGFRYSGGANLKAEAVGYWSEVHNDLFNVVDPETPTRGFFTNLDRTRRQGVELSVTVDDLLVPGLTLTGSAALTRATFQSEATLAAPFLETDEDDESDPDEAADPDEPSLQPPAVEPGDRFPMVPTVTGSLGARYATREWTVGINGQFVGRQYLVGDEGNTAAFGHLDRYGVVDAFVERTLGPASVFVRAQNLLDAEYETFGIISANVRVGPGEDERIERFLSPGRPFRLYGGVRYTLGRVR